MPVGIKGAERCDDFGWHPHGAIDPALVAETVQHPTFGVGQAWSNSAAYRLTVTPGRIYLVYTVEGGFDFTVDGSTVGADAGTLILLDGEAPTTARTTSRTARFVWYLDSTVLRPGRSRFRFHEPIPMQNVSLQSLMAMTHAVLAAPAPSTEPARRHLGMSMEHLISGALDEAGGVVLGTDSRHRDGLFMAAQSSIDAHFSDPAFDVTRLARDLSVSARTAYDTFSRLGTTPRREIERRRVAEIERLVAVARLSASELADRSGFSSPKQMRRALARSADPGS